MGLKARPFYRWRKHFTDRRRETKQSRYAGTPAVWVEGPIWVRNGFDGSNDGLDSVSRLVTWPRYQGDQTTDANDNIAIPESEALAA